MSHWETCPACRGRGSDRLNNLRCEHCKGTGQVPGAKVSKAAVEKAPPQKRAKRSSERLPFQAQFFERKEKIR